MWIIPGLIPFGLTLLAGKAKLGKSFLCLNLSFTLSSKSEYKFLSKYNCQLTSNGLSPEEIKQADPPTVLYLALEDTSRRIQDRGYKLLLSRLKEAQVTSGDIGFDFWCYTKSPKIGDGAIACWENFIKNHPNTKLIIIDTFAQIRREKTNQRGNVYYDDYNSIKEIKDFADRHKIGIVVIHHTNKMSTDDIFDTISGSTGLSGASDTIAVMHNYGKKSDSILRIKGREVEDQEIALKWNKDTWLWESLGDAEQYRVSRLESDIIDCLENYQSGLSPKDISEMVNKSSGSIRVTLLRLIKMGKIKKTAYGKYILKPPSFEESIKELVW